VSVAFSSAMLKTKAPRYNKVKKDETKNKSLINHILSKMSPLSS